MVEPFVPFASSAASKIEKVFGPTTFLSCGRLAKTCGSTALNLAAERSKSEPFPAIVWIAVFLIASYAVFRRSNLN